MCTELRRLEIEILCDDEDADYSRNEDSGSDSDSEWMDLAGFGPESHLYGTGFSKVSKFLGFDLVPNLKISIKKNYDFERVTFP